MSVQRRDDPYIVIVRDLPVLDDSTVDEGEIVRALLKVSELA